MAGFTSETNNDDEDLLQSRRDVQNKEQPYRRKKLSARLGVVAFVYLCNPERPDDNEYTPHGMEHKRYRSKYGNEIRRDPPLMPSHTNCGHCCDRVLTTLTYKLATNSSVLTYRHRHHSKTSPPQRAAGPSRDQPKLHGKLLPELRPRALCENRMLWHLHCDLLMACSELTKLETV